MGQESAGGDMRDMSESRAEELVQLVSFELEGEEFGIDILKVQEIIRMVTITKVPQAPNYAEGVINLRGNIIPVIDLRTLFAMSRRAYDKNSRIAVCAVGSAIIGLVVDSVSEVLRVPPSTLEKPPSAVTVDSSQYISGVVKLDNRLLLVLDISRLTAEVSVEFAASAEAEPVMA
jgi:purine-binding chemotaxis protein CheW